MGCLDTLKISFMAGDGCFQFFDVLYATFSECCLCLSIPLLPLLDCGIYLFWSTSQAFIADCFMNVPASCQLYDWAGLGSVKVNPLHELAGNPLNRPTFVSSFRDKI
jgi:hypothetical protein